MKKKDEDKDEEKVYKRKERIIRKKKINKEVLKIEKEK